MVPCNYDSLHSLSILLFKQEYDNICSAKGGREKWRNVESRLRLTPRNNEQCPKRWGEAAGIEIYYLWTLATKYTYKTNRIEWNAIIYPTTAAIGEWNGKGMECGSGGVKMAIKTIVLIIRKMKRSSFPSSWGGSMASWPLVWSGIIFPLNNHRSSLRCE